jgi:hypothetical protein
LFLNSIPYHSAFPYGWKISPPHLFKGIFWRDFRKIEK